MQIGELADRTGLSLRTLRHYDEIGLLRPSTRTEGGFRVYSEKDFSQLTLIRQARALKFSLEEISELLDVLAARPRHPELMKLDAMEALLDEARSRRAKLVTDLERADELITDLTTLLQHSNQQATRPV